MSTENIYEIIKASNQVSKLVEDSNADLEGNNSNALLWILGGMVVLGLVLYFNSEMKEKKTTR